MKLHNNNESTMKMANRNCLLAKRVSSKYENAHNEARKWRNERKRIEWCQRCIKTNKNENRDNERR